MRTSTTICCSRPSSYWPSNIIDPLSTVSILIPLCLDSSEQVQLMLFFSVLSERERLIAYESWIYQVYFDMSMLNVADSFVNFLLNNKKNADNVVVAGWREAIQAFLWAHPKNIPSQHSLGRIHFECYDGTGHQLIELIKFWRQSSNCGKTSFWKTNDTDDNSANQWIPSRKNLKELPKSGRGNRLQIDDGD